MAQDLRQVLRTDLARSPAAVRQLSQTDLLCHFLFLSQLKT
jgi:hypothetical protein